MHRTVALAAVVLLGPTPVVAESLYSYNGFPHAEIAVDGRRVNITVHPKVNKLLLQSKLGEVLSNDQPGFWPIQVWRQAAENFVAPMGCGVSEVVAKNQKGGLWEATYVCPGGLNLRKAADAQRKSLKAGNPLKPAANPIVTP